MSQRLSPGDTAPDFTLGDDTGAQTTLSELRGGKVIVYFYPAAMTPGCTKQACDFSDSLESLQSAGYTVLGISPDKPEKLARFRERDGLTLTSDTGDDVALSDFLGRKVIVYFYPAAMTPGCTKQACDFTDSLDSLQAQGYEVIGISPDKPEKLAKFRERDGLTITLLSDPDKEVLEAYGAFGEKTMYGKTVQGVIRSTFVIDEEGKVEVAQYNVRATGHVEKLRRELSLD